MIGPLWLKPTGKQVVFFTSADIDGYSQRIEYWVAWTSGQKTLSGPSRTPKDTAIGGSRASKTPETVVYAPDTEDQEDNRSRSEEELDPDFKWTPSAGKSDLSSDVWC
jgi:hypothetical protein